MGALGAVSAGLVVEAYLQAPPELREAYRAAMRAAGERITDVLQDQVKSKVPAVVAAAAEFLGLSGSPDVAPQLFDLTHHKDERVREAALLGLAELGGREIARPAMPLLKDDSVLVRTARQQVETVDFTTSNVRGAPFDLYIAGAHIDANYPLGPVAGTAFNATTLSVAGSLDLGVHTDTAAVDDPGALRDAIQESFDELLSIGGRPKRPRKPG